MAKQELVATIRDRYRTSSKREKTRILDEFIAVTGHHRKHGIRLLGQSGNRGEAVSAVSDIGFRGRRPNNSITAFHSPSEEWVTLLARIKPLQSTMTFSW